jgi:hypothetical protein
MIPHDRLKGSNARFILLPSDKRPLRSACGSQSRCSLMKQLALGSLAFEFSRTSKIRCRQCLFLRSDLRRLLSRDVDAGCDLVRIGDGYYYVGTRPCRSGHGKFIGRI